RTLGENYDRLMERRASWTPMQRNVTVADVAETIYSLVGGHPFLTGETIVIDGGFRPTTSAGLRSRHDARFAAHRARGAVDAGAPVLLRLALPAVRGGTGDGRAAGGAGV